MTGRIARLFPLLAVLGPLAACGGDGAPFEPYQYPDPEQRRVEGLGSVFGEDALSFGGPDKPEAGGAGIAVNSFLWRASLDTVSFMPLVSADPFGGVIITDWYAPPETPNERFKVTVYILGRDLRADGVRATVFRQRLDETGAWRDVAVEPSTGPELEEAILTRARQMRVAGLQ